MVGSPSAVPPRDTSRLGRETTTERQTSGRDELSSTLAELRRAAGLNTRQAAEGAGFSQAKVSRVERGINVPTEADVHTLATVYDAAEDVLRRLVTLARDVRAVRRPVVMARPQDRPSLFQERLARIEAGSAHVGTFSNTVVPGLLQTEPYMRELFAPRQLDPAEEDRMVAARLARQSRLDDDARTCTLIIAEGALGWRAGTGDQMAEQVDRIASATRRDSARVGVIPWGTRVGRFPLHAWDLYDERAVSYGTVDATAILTEPRDVAAYVALFERLVGCAVFGDEARTVLGRIADGYRALTTDETRS